MVASSIEYVGDEQRSVIRFYGEIVKVKLVKFTEEW
jgi:hypothetical protein